MNRYGLYIDVATNWCALAVLDNQKVLNKLIIKTENNLIDIFHIKLDELLKEENINLKDLKDIYLVNGPGSFTSIKAGLNLAKTIKFIFKTNLYIVDTLKVMHCGNGIAILDAKGNQSYFSIYKNNYPLVDLSLINNDQIDRYLEKYSDLIIYNEMNTDINQRVINGLNHLNLFTLINNDQWLDLEPFYIKNPI